MNDFEKIPRHVAIIMDGNRRWAKRRGWLGYFGHKAGAAALVRVVKAAKKAGIRTLTLFAFSTENWSRAPIEVRAILRVLRTTLIEQLPCFIEEGVRFHAIGDLSRFDAPLQEIIDNTTRETRGGEALDLVVALSYGGRDEIVRAVKSCFFDLSLGKLKADCLNEKTFESYLETAAWKEPDLVIRTGGDQRLSNFLLWQNAYAVLYFTDRLWPDFTEEDLHQALFSFTQRKRRYGQ